MIKPLVNLAATLVLATGIAGPAAARAPLPVPGTKTAAQALAMPLPSTVRLFRQIARSGVTKPAGAALDARLGTKPSLETESRRLGQLVRTSVCIGC